MKPLTAAALALALLFAPTTSFAHETATGLYPGVTPLPCTTNSTSGVFCFESSGCPCRGPERQRQEKRPWPPPLVRRPAGA